MISVTISAWLSIRACTILHSHQSAAAAAKSLSCVWLCDPMDCSPPGSPIHGIFQAKVLEWMLLPSPHQQCTVVLISSCPFQHLPCVLVVDILTVVRWYLIMVLICLSSMISGIEHIFIFVGHLSSLKKFLLSPLSNIYLGYCFLILSCRNSLFWI